MRPKIVTWIGVGVSLGMVVYIATRFDLASAVRAIELASPLWLVAATLTYCVQFPLRGLRWSILMRAVKPVSFGAATEVFTIGFMANNVLPARLGDVARAFILARREGIPASATFSNVVLERVFDGLTVVGFLATVLWLDPPHADWIGPVAVSAALLFVGAVAVAVLVAFFEDAVLKILGSTLRFVPSELKAKLLALVQKLARGFHCLRRPRETLMVIALSLLIWSAEVVVYVLVQNALGISISPLGLTLVMAMLTLGLTVPSAPGFVGVYEALIIGSVGIYGVHDPLAPAFAITMHLIHYVPGTVLGLIGAWKSGLRLKELQQVGDEIGPDTALAVEEAKASVP
jgi:uncharacterized protein (TIRG00374 family)